MRQHFPVVQQKQAETRHRCENVRGPVARAEGLHSLAGEQIGELDGLAK
jgi:hypothetical protein